MWPPQLNFWNGQALCKSGRTAVDGSNITAERVPGWERVGDSRKNISPRCKKQTAEFQGVQRAIQKSVFWRLSDVATLSVQIESTDHTHPTWGAEK